MMLILTDPIIVTKGAPHALSGQSTPLGDIIVHADIDRRGIGEHGVMSSSAMEKSDR